MRHLRYRSEVDARYVVVLRWVGVVLIVAVASLLLVAGFTAVFT